VWAVALITALDLFASTDTGFDARGPCQRGGGFRRAKSGAGRHHRLLHRAGRSVCGGRYDSIRRCHGRVEHLTLRRTVIRDARGALVTIANGDIRTVANLSRDWSQTFVDVELAPEIALEKPLACARSSVGRLRAMRVVTALVDGPRILGVQSLGRSATLVRLQARTAPTRQG